MRNYQIRDDSAVFSLRVCVVSASCACSACVSIPGGVFGIEIERCFGICGGICAGFGGIFCGKACAVGGFDCGRTDDFSYGAGKKVLNRLNRKAMEVLSATKVSILLRPNLACFQAPVKKPPPKKTITGIASTI